MLLVWCSHGCPGPQLGFRNSRMPGLQIVLKAVATGPFVALAFCLYNRTAFKLLLTRVSYCLKCRKIPWRVELRRRTVLLSQTQGSIRRDSSNSVDVEYCRTPTGSGSSQSATSTHQRRSRRACRSMPPQPMRPSTQPTISGHASLICHNSSAVSLSCAQSEVLLQMLLPRRDAAW